MRVLAIIPGLGAGGGAERSLADLSAPLVGLGCSLDVVCYTDRRALRPVLEQAGARVFAIEPGSRASTVRALAALIGRLQPDLVHTSLVDAGLVGRIAAAVRRVPVVSSHTGETYGPDAFVAPNRPWKVRTVQGADIVTAKLCVRHHAVSHRIASLLVDRLRVRPDRIDVIHRGRSAAKLGVRSESRRLAARSMLGLSAEQPVVLAVGRQELVKNQVFLIEVFTELLKRKPSSVLLLAGRPGTASAKICSRIDELGVGAAVRQLGQRDDVAALLCAADLVALPSLQEGFPGALVEALALECPIIASDIPSVREVIEPNPASVVLPFDDQRAWVQAMESSLTTRPQTSEMRRRFESHFTVEATAAQTLAFYERALAIRSRHS